MPTYFTKSDRRPITEMMQELIQTWEAASDQRAIFLNCYVLMTRNMLTAVDAGEFIDQEWVYALLHRFADYYFYALEAYEQQNAGTPAVWRTAHDATREPQTHILQNMLLGINAHINYDLVLTLVDMLEPEWAELSSLQRAQRYSDHCHVNAIIGRTVDVVQDQVVEQLAPEMDIVDKVLGPIDEWTASRLIAHWRDDVWQQGVRLMEIAEPVDRERVRQQIETTTLRRSEAILLKDGLFSIRHLL